MSREQDLIKGNEKHTSLQSISFCWCRKEEIIKSRDTCEGSFNYIYDGRQTCPPPRSQRMLQCKPTISPETYIVLQKQTEKKKKKIIKNRNKYKKAKDIMTTFQDKRRQPYNFKIARACQTNATIARAPKLDNKLNAMHVEGQQIITT